MFFNEEVSFFEAITREFYSNNEFEVPPILRNLRSVPTHTEDGIPIRKIYVSNLPPKTSRAELFGVFAQYGFIKSCWLNSQPYYNQAEKGPNKPSPTYAFVTFSNPEDAHKALQAPSHEKTLRGRILRISPADSWHQPTDDSNMKGPSWKARNNQQTGADNPCASTSSSSQMQEIIQNNPEPTSQDGNQEGDIIDENQFNIMDVLNNDCLTQILSYVPVTHLLRSERVSKRWQSMIQEYLQGIRTFKTSWWQHDTLTLTTAVLRRTLQRLGLGLVKLHLDHHWSALNDRTAHIVGKFCPDLEELKIVGMHTKNWNPLIYGCKNLRSLSFISCNKLADSSLVHLVKNDTAVECLTVANNSHVTGLFLTGSKPSKLKSLSFYNCYSLQGTVLCAAIDSLPCLTTLKLDVGPSGLWNLVPLILKSLPKLEELSLSEYASSTDMTTTPPGPEALCEALSAMTELKILNLSRNSYIMNAHMKQVAQSCPKLHTLNIACCNGRRLNGQLGVTEDGMMAIVSGCSALRSLDLSYLTTLKDSTLNAVTRLRSLQRLATRGNPAITAAPFVNLFNNCPHLEEVDLCGCDNIAFDLLQSAMHATNIMPRPRPLTLWVAGTLLAATDLSEIKPNPRYLILNTEDDRSDPHLRPDFIDQVFEYNSDDSIGDIYDPANYDDFLDSDDESEYFDLEDLENGMVEGVYEFDIGIEAPNIILF